jgi:hypothetical protein
MTDEAMSPLRRRMIEDMTIRKFAPKTQHDYLQRVKNFAAFLGRSPDTASFEDVRRVSLGDINGPSRLELDLDIMTAGDGAITINKPSSTFTPSVASASCNAAKKAHARGTSGRQPAS